MNNKDSWEEKCKDIQNRSLDMTELKVKSAITLWAEILRILILAVDDKILSTQQDEIRRLLKIYPSFKNGKKHIEIMGGEKNQHRELEIPHFKLLNGCWFDFAISIYEIDKKNAEIFAFDFEIRHPPKISNWFLRFDLNPPNHNNETRNMRFHFHPSNEDIMIHSPPMSPLEILHLFLYGIDIPDKPRSTKTSKEIQQNESNDIYSFKENN